MEIVCGLIAAREETAVHRAEFHGSEKTVFSVVGVDCVEECLLLS